MIDHGSRELQEQDGARAAQGRKIAGGDKRTRSKEAHPRQRSKSRTERERREEGAEIVHASCFLMHTTLVCTFVRLSACSFLGCFVGSGQVQGPDPERRGAIVCVRMRICTDTSIRRLRWHSQSKESQGDLGSGSGSGSGSCRVERCSDDFAVFLLGYTRPEGYGTEWDTCNRHRQSARTKVFHHHEREEIREREREPHSPADDQSHDQHAQTPSPPVGAPPAYPASPGSRHGSSIGASRVS